MIKKEKNITTIIGLFIMFFSFNLAAQDQINNYLKIAANNNPGLKAKYFQYQAALEQSNISGSLPDPMISFGYFIQPVETRVGPQIAKFSAQQMFPWLGTLSLKEKKATQLAKSKFEAFNRHKSLLYQNVRTLYYDLYISEKSIAITQKNIELLNAIHDLTIAKTKSGINNFSDGLYVEMEIADLQNKIKQLTDQKWYLETKFKNLINKDTIISVSDSLNDINFNVSQSDAYLHILKANHDLLILKHKINEFITNKELAKNDGKPSFNVGFDYMIIGKNELNNGSSSNGKDAFIFPKIGITIPLYRNKYRAIVKKAEYLIDSAEEEKELKKNRLENLLELYFNEYKDANRRIEHYQMQTSRALKILHIKESEYTVESADFEELIRLQRTIYRYELKYEQALVDKQSAIAFINFLMGK